MSKLIDRLPDVLRVLLGLAFTTLGRQFLPALPAAAAHPPGSPLNSEYPGYPVGQYNLHRGTCVVNDGVSQSGSVTDVDGRSYIDFNCANGPNLLGYLHPEVEAAAQRQGARGDMVPHFSPRMIELCERLLKWNDKFDWAIPVKRGSDATELALRIARVTTRRKRVLLFKRSYHGTNKELAVMQEGIPDAWEHIVRVDWNDSAGLDAVTPTPPN